MKVSTKGRYGLKAMIDIAVYGEDKYITIKSIAERQNISETYLEQLIALLRKAGLVISARGAQGGYRLSRPPSEIKAGEILKALEGSIAPISCVDEENSSDCSDNCNFCVSKKVWGTVYEAMKDALDTIDLAELALNYKELNN